MHLTFNFYYDLLFWLAFAFIAILLRFLRSARRLRIAALLGSNIVMLLALPAFGIQSLLFVLSITSVTWMMGWALSKDAMLAAKRNRLLFSISAVSLLVSILVFFKYSVVQEKLYAAIGGAPFGASKAIFVVGISYFSFKMIHFVVECYKRKISSFSALTFFNYALFFPSFISGPITRYGDFHKQLHSENKGTLRTDLSAGSERIIHGLFKKFVLCPIVWPYVFANLPGPIGQLPASQLFTGMFAYTLYIYFDFAGYSDMAIGCSRIMGIGLPENFNNPFLKKNIQELWANWHMTLTRWLTDYIYWPLVKKLRRSPYLAAHPVLLSNICIIATFIICGMWHGESWNFVVWGAYHGLGLACLNIYQKYKRRTRNPSLRKYFLSPYSIMTGRIGTFMFFAAGIVLFSMDIENLMFLFSRMLSPL